MSALGAALGDYLGLRRALGHKLAEHERQLNRFVARLDDAGASFVAMADALAFVLDPDLDPASSNPAKRLMAVRGFTRYLSAIDPRTEVPPAGLVSYRPSSRAPLGSRGVAPSSGVWGSIAAVVTSEALPPCLGGHGRGFWVLRGAAMLTISPDPVRVESQLSSGALVCPGCGGQLGPCTWARPSGGRPSGSLSAGASASGPLSWLPVTHVLLPRRCCCAGVTWSR